MLRFFRLAAVALLFGGLSYGQEGFNLAPGEILLGVNGVPVQQTRGQVQQRGTQVQQPSCANGSCVVPMRPAVRASGGYPPIIGEGTAAYQHALREAQIIASRGGNYHRHGDGGHPLGNAPGCTHSGTGFTWDVNRPGHCWEDELPQSRIVARARAQGVNGAWFWSAHYR